MPGNIIPGIIPCGAEPSAAFAVPSFPSFSGIMDDDQHNYEGNKFHK